MVVPGMWFILTTLVQKEDRRVWLPLIGLNLVIADCNKPASIAIRDGPQ